MSQLSSYPSSLPLSSSSSSSSSPPPVPSSSDPIVRLLPPPPPFLPSSLPLRSVYVDPSSSSDAKISDIQNFRFPLDYIESGIKTQTTQIINRAFNRHENNENNNDNPSSLYSFSSNSNDDEGKEEKKSDSPSASSPYLSPPHSLPTLLPLSTSYALGGLPAHPPPSRHPDPILANKTFLIPYKLQSQNQRNRNAHNAQNQNNSNPNGPYPYVSPPPSSLFSSSTSLSSHYEYNENLLQRLIEFMSKNVLEGNPVDYQMDFDIIMGMAQKHYGGHNDNDNGTDNSDTSPPSLIHRGNVFSFLPHFHEAQHKAWFHENFRAEMENMNRRIFLYTVEQMNTILFPYKWSEEKQKMVYPEKTQMEIFHHQQENEFHRHQIKKENHLDFKKMKILLSNIHRLEDQQISMLEMEVQKNQIFHQRVWEWSEYADEKRERRRKEKKMERENLKFLRGNDNADGRTGRALIKAAETEKNLRIVLQWYRKHQETFNQIGIEMERERREKEKEKKKKREESLSQSLILYHLSPPPSPSPLSFRISRMQLVLSLASHLQFLQKKWGLYEKEMKIIRRKMNDTQKQTEKEINKLLTSCQSLPLSISKEKLDEILSNPFLKKMETGRAKLCQQYDEENSQLEKRKEERQREWERRKLAGKEREREREKGMNSATMSANDSIEILKISSSEPIIKTLMQMTPDGNQWDDAEEKEELLDQNLIDSLSLHIRRLSPPSPLIYIPLHHFHKYFAKHLELMKWIAQEEQRRKVRSEYQHKMEILHEEKKKLLTERDQMRNSSESHIQCLDDQHKKKMMVTMMMEFYKRENDRKAMDEIKNKISEGEGQGDFNGSNYEYHLAPNKKIKVQVSDIYEEALELFVWGTVEGEQNEGKMKIFRELDKEREKGEGRGKEEGKGEGEEEKVKQKEKNRKRRNPPASSSSSSSPPSPSPSLSSSSSSCSSDDFYFSPPPPTTSPHLCVDMKLIFDCALDSLILDTNTKPQKSTEERKGKGKGKDNGEEDSENGNDDDEEDDDDDEYSKAQREVQFQYCQYVQWRREESDKQIQLSQQRIEVLRSMLSGTPEYFHRKDPDGEFSWMELEIKREKMENKIQNLRHKMKQIEMKNKNKNPKGKERKGEGEGEREGKEKEEEKGKGKGERERDGDGMEMENSNCEYHSNETSDSEYSSLSQDESFLSSSLSSLLSSYPMYSDWVSSCKMLQSHLIEEESRLWENRNGGRPPIEEIYKNYENMVGKHIHPYYGYMVNLRVQQEEKKKKDEEENKKKAEEQQKEMERMVQEGKAKKMREKEKEKEKEKENTHPINFNIHSQKGRGAGGGGVGGGRGGIQKKK